MDATFLGSSRVETCNGEGEEEEVEVEDLLAFESDASRQAKDGNGEKQRVSATFLPEHSSFFESQEREHSFSKARKGFNICSASLRK
jgi:hypothetical protein